MEPVFNSPGKGLGHFSEEFFRNYVIKFKPIVVDLFAKYSSKKVDKHEINDILQDSVMICYQKNHDPDFVLRESEEKFFYGVARNNVLQYLKKRNNIKIVELEDEEFYESEPPTTSNELSKLLLKCLELLEGRKKEILTLFYFKRRSMKEISKILSFANEDVVKTTAYRAKNDMHDCLKSRKNENE